MRIKSSTLRSARFFGCFAFFLAQIAYAATHTGTVAMLEVWENGNVAFSLLPNVPDCNSQFVINFSKDGANNLYAAVLAAKMKGTPITVNTSGCGPAENYGGSYNIPQYVYVLD